MLGVPEIDGGAGGVSTETVMVNAGSDAAREPSLTLMTMSESAPTFAASGVPVSLPVVASNVAQAGLLVIEKVSFFTEAPEMLG